MAPALTAGPYGRFDTPLLTGQLVENPASTNRLNDNLWHHLAITYSSSNSSARVYLDGDLEAEKTIQGQFPNPVANFRLGQPGWTSKAWKGDIDEIRFYNRALNPEEIPLLPITYSDPDNDGLSNLEEFQKGTDPLNPDTDGDGIPDKDDPIINPPDNDHDGILDAWETEHGLNPNDPSDALLDPDNDGLTNLQEFQAGSNPHNSDTDNDGIPDGFEVAHGLNPNQNDALADLDGDGVSNITEFKLGRNPNAGAVADTGNVVSLNLFTPLE